MTDKIIFIEDCLEDWENWMHGEDGKNVTLCREYLLQLKKELQSVKGERERLKEALDLCYEAKKEST